MAELPFHPMISNLIALLQLGGTIVFGQLIADRLLEASGWLWRLAVGMVISSQAAYLVTFFPEFFWILDLMAWGLALGGFVFVGQFLHNNRLKFRIERPNSLASWLAMLLSGSYVLLALGPPTQADALDYHWGVPIYLIRHHHWPSMEMWMTGSLAGIGEMYILIGMLLHAENLSTLLQAISLVGFAYWISKDQMSLKADFLRIFVLGVPVLLFFVSGPKPQLFPQVLTALALYLTILKKQIGQKTYILIVLLLCGAAQQKLSFILTGGLIGIWASYKNLPSNPRGIIIAVGLVAIFFIPRAWWNWHQVPEPNWLTWLTPLPEEFTNGLRSFREQDWWFPFNLFVPDSVGSTSAIIGIQLLLVVMFYSSDRRWREVVVLAALGSMLTYGFGQSIARSFYEFLLWIVVGASLTEINQRLLPYGFFALQCQCLAVFGMALTGLWNLLPGTLSKELRTSTLKKTAHQFQVIDWTNKIIPPKSMIATDFRSVAFVSNNFIPLKYTNNNYLDSICKNKIEYLVSSNKDLETKLDVLKLINKNEDFTSSTRNPFNSGSKYSGYLYKVTKKCSSQ